MTVIDVAHEILIYQWPQLRKWIDKNRDALRKQREIETAAREWRDKSKHADYLLQGPKLNTAEDYLNKNCGIEYKELNQYAR